MSAEKTIEGMENVGVSAGLMLRKVFQFIESTVRKGFKIFVFGGIGIIIGIFIGLSGGRK